MSIINTKPKTAPADEALDLALEWLRLRREDPMSPASGGDLALISIAQSLATIAAAAKAR